ncbi:hypothetical protein SPI_07484 [Niveomyces insectorum RCEF 264]|uniref:SnoaL-like domain-containing protein n=1 Tax=Niveomyces insectorum RCEF 264 TaxID=1081102 RepID=A0A167PWQ2_9HYPO|nr:hypothetical protein SPI_07484 [Niveomyces insectorum RCEF 264]
MADDVAQLKQTVDALQKKVTELDDQEQIRKLQYTYGYYLDKCLYKEVAGLYSDDPDAYVQFLGGRYLRRAGVERLYLKRFGGFFVGGRNGPVHGFLLDHPQMQGIVDVNYDTPDGRPRAQGRFRSLMQAGVHISQADRHPRGFTQWFEGGIYENEYIKEDGVWKILHLRYFPFWHGDVEHGWGYKVSGFVPFPTKTFPEDPMGPDEVVSADQRMLWPDCRVVPFHYTHPITGEQVRDEDLQAPLYGGDVKEALPALKLVG